MAQESRQRIIEALKRRGQASVKELSDALDLTTVTIRHHLQILSESGVLSAPIKRKKSGRGRPEMIYSLREDIHEHLPQNFEALGINIVLTLVEDMHPIELAGMLHKAGLHAAETAGLPKGARIHDRMEHTAHYLNSHGYMARCKLVDEMPEVTFSNCPYYHLACQVPLLCTYDRALVETGLARPMQLGSRIIHEDGVCKFTSDGP
jgi:predicted ArsR family transcriptional regulator